MSTRIAINTQTAYGKAIAEYVDLVMQARAAGERLKRAMDSMIAGTPGTPAVIDTEVNGPGFADPVRGQAIFDLITNSNNNLQRPAVDALAAIDQG